jgi:hypothetical protein
VHVHVLAGRRMSWPRFHGKRGAPRGGRQQNGSSHRSRRDY